MIPVIASTSSPSRTLRQAGLRAATGVCGIGLWPWTGGLGWVWGRLISRSRVEAANGIDAQVNGRRDQGESNDQAAGAETGIEQAGRPGRQPSEIAHGQRQ